MARPVPPSGAGDLLKLSAERCPAAEAGRPWHADVVQLGHSRRIGPRGAGFNLAQLGRELGQQRGPYLRPVRVLDGGPGGLKRHREQPPAAALPSAARRRDLAAERRHRRRVDRREPERQGAGDVAQLEPRQRRSEQDVDVAAAGGRNVGEDLAAAPGHEPGEGLGLGTDSVREVGVKLMVVLDSTIVNVAACAARVEVEGQHPPRGRGRLVDRHRARLVRRLGGQRPGVPRRVGAAAVARDPGVLSTGDRGRDRMPSGLCGSAREAVRTARSRYRDTRRVARGQC